MVFQFYTDVLKIATEVNFALKPAMKALTLLLNLRARLD
jgi:hypothetical protein